MKQIFITIFYFLFSLSAQAWISSPQFEKEYNFRFIFQKEIYEKKQTAASYEEAFEKAAKSCFQHFKSGRRISEETGLDIIDVCANPRSF